MDIAHLLAEKWNKEDLAAGAKPTALGTAYRYSAAHNCSRQLAYAALNAEQTELFDAPSSWVTRLGTMIHEEMQEAIKEVYPDAEFEVASQVDANLSGSCDGILTHAGEKVVIEIKTRGQYAWQKETGYGQWKKTEPKGPSLAAVCQAGLNAIGLGAEYVCMVSLAKECISVSKRRKLDIDNSYEAFAAEWWIPREEWEPLAQAEMARVQEIEEGLTVRGYLPAPEIVNDDGQRESVKIGSHWACDYCAFRSTCESDGNGIVPVAISNYKEKQ